MSRADKGFETIIEELRNLETAAYKARLKVAEEASAILYDIKDLPYVQPTGPHTDNHSQVNARWAEIEAVRRTYDKVDPIDKDLEYVLLKLSMLRRDLTLYYHQRGRNI